MLRYQLLGVIPLPHTKKQLLDGDRKHLSMKREGKLVSKQPQEKDLCSLEKMVLLQGFQTKYTTDDIH